MNSYQRAGLEARAGCLAVRGAGSMAGRLVGWLSALSSGHERIAVTSQCMCRGRENQAGLLAMYVRSRRYAQGHTRAGLAREPGLVL